ncbi:MAG: hypothetical protein U0587_15875 [Candidatus Binatia bacterium]
MGERGTALLTTLGIMLLLLPLGAYVVMQCRSDLLVQRNFRDEIEAFHIAEAGLDHAVAEIKPGGTLSGLLVGPDGLAGTADDGLFPFSEGTPLDFPVSPFHYDVRVTSLGANAMSLVSQGSGQNGATKVLAATVARSPLVWTPAALYGRGDVANLDLGDGRFLLSGFDHRIDDGPANPTGSAQAIPALGSSEPEAAELLRRSLGEALATRVVGSGGPPSVATTAAVDVTGLVAELTGRADGLRLPAIAAVDAVQLGTSDAPWLVVVDGDVTVAGRVSGAGVLVVAGRLQVTGQLEYAGLVVALGDVAFGPASDVTIAGAFWHGATGGNVMRLQGAGAIVYSSQALAQVDAAFPALLPHAAVVTGWLEQL